MGQIKIVTQSWIKVLHKQGQTIFTENLFLD